MPDPFIGEIKLVSWSYAPRGWALCDGRMLPIPPNQNLFKLLGTTYGGDGKTIFGVPDLRGRAAMHFSQQLPMGAFTGEPTHTLLYQEVPGHTHEMVGGTGPGTVSPVAPAQWLAAITDGQQGFGYAPPPPNMQDTLQMSPYNIAATGTGQAHENRQPYLCMNYIIATAGIYPSKG
jgi:microcystin-dependent protein